MRVYLDYAATTPIDPRVLKAMLPYLKKKFGNASSLHSFGQEAFEAMEKARKQVAGFLNCFIDEIIFTGSATEADNLAILGVVKATKGKDSKPHVITTQIEHPAVLKPCEQLARDGVDVTFLPVDKDGIVRVNDVEKAIKSNTVLVSIMYANNEIGVIQPIAAIGKIIKTINQRNGANDRLKIIFHTDAVQAVNYLDCDVQKLAVDLLTMSGHKIYGPKGVGVLFARKGTQVSPLIYGGGQEQRKRPGTENVAGIVGFSEAIQQVQSSKFKVQSLLRLRDKLLNGILKKIPGTTLNGSRESRLPNNVSISFEGVEGESLLMALDQEGIAVSTGSACASGSLEPSHVLMAMGLSHERAHGSIRFTLGRNTTAEEIDKVLRVLPRVVKQLRDISPLK